MGQIIKSIGILSVALLVSGCGSFTKSCEQEDFTNMMLKTSWMEGGLDILKLSDAKLVDIIELKRDEKTAVCSGKMIGTRLSRQNEKVTWENEFTWKVEETQDGKNFFTWVQGRQSASDME